MKRLIFGAMMAATAILSGCYGSVGPDGVKGGVYGVGEGEVSSERVYGRSASGSSAEYGDNGVNSSSGSGKYCQVTCNDAPYIANCPDGQSAQCQCSRAPYAQCVDASKKNK